MADIEQYLNKIICGDAIEVMAEMPDASVDMILCDLPYGTTACKWDTIIPFEPLWAQYKRIAKKNAAIVLTGSQPFTSKLIMSNLEMFKYEWVWVKTKATGHLDANRKPMKKHEEVVVFGGKGWPQYYPQGLVDGIFKTGRDTSGSLYSASKNHGYSVKGNHPQDVIEYANPSGKGHLHPTQKPVALFEYLIRTYTNAGDIVLDNCIGSGTTAVACIKTGRKYIGIELSEEYCEIAEKRIAAELSQPELVIAT